MIAPGFQPLRDAFDDLLEARPGWSGALAAHHRGELVAHLHGGPDYRSDSVQLIWSSSKGVAALALAALIDDGRLDPEAPVAAYWPEFAEGGKAGVTVRLLLSHQAGLSSVDGGFSVDDVIEHDRLAKRLATQEPLWEPGSAHGYHALTFGTLVGELFRRITGSTVGSWLAAEFPELDVWFGLPESVEPRLVPLFTPIGFDPKSPIVHALLTPDTLTRRAYSLDFGARVGNERRLRAGEVLSVGGVASAKGLAGLYAAFLERLSPSTLDVIARPHASGHDLILLQDNAYGLGFQVEGGTFGHDGLGGSLAFADPTAELSFAFITNHMPVRGFADECTGPLVEALRGCLPEPDSGVRG
ncbi:serine hydrolase [Allokutzneria sp. NRRL B-24872]|uniref:serine hydrolase domain-containing protein n=1 Tax=Allokutzneria sp. NRRL B-24872 TaxID=1137961 RepID=UPI000A3BD8C1|nr:serine hydrolase domain-containing protein [Allokutzneria sp. NRRL B-24872]